MRNVILLLLLMLSAPLLAEPVDIDVLISEPYLELHKGPGKTYRVEHIILQGEKVTIKKQNADWFYVTQNEKVSGWAPMENMLDNQVEVASMTFDEFMLAFEGDLLFDLSFSSGFIEDDFFLGIEFGHRFDDDLRFAFSLRQVPGKVSETIFASGDLNYFYGKVGSVVPLLVVGYGIMENTPSEQVIGGEVINSEFWKLGLGVVFAQSKRISFTAIINQYAPVDNVFETDPVELAIGLNYFY